MSRVNYTVLGQEKSGTIEDLRQDVVMLGKKASNADRVFAEAERDLLAALVAWGALLTQARPMVQEGTFKGWLDQCGCSHKQKAYSAMKCAAGLADAHGHLDRAKLKLVIERYNRECAGREGFTPLVLKPCGSASVRTAEVALGLRPHRSGLAARAGTPVESGAPDSRRVDILDGPDVLDLHIKPVEPRVVGVVGGVAGVGGQQTTPSSVLLNRRAVEVNGGGPDSVSFLRPGRERDAGVSPASHGLPPALESRQRVQPSAQGNAAAPAGMRETSRPAVGGGGQASRHLGIEASRAIQAHAGDQRATQPVQLTLAGEYELAAKKATLLVERIASGHASPEIVRKLIALCEEAERGEMVAGGGR